MLTSPITVTIATVAHSLSRINQDNYGSTYLKKGADFEIRLVLKHSYEKTTATGQMERHQAELTWTSFDTDGNPLSTQAYHVVRPKRGSDGVLASDLEKALNTFMTSNITAIVGWES